MLCRDVPYSTREAIQQARMLRAGMTDAEECLWMRIRGHQLDGLRFRRQMPIGITSSISPVSPLG
jgi:very-short-patch-repair endonuclease